MTKVVFVPPSTVAPPPPTSSHNAPFKVPMSNIPPVVSGSLPSPMAQPPSKPKIWEATDLKSIVDDMVATDPRFTGLARYMVNVHFYWSYEIETACAGHGFIFFNPDFYEHLPPETRKTVIVHEVWHIILKHLERGEGFDPVIHNIAADHVINIAITDEGFTWEGFDPVMDKKRFKGQSTEQIYDTIWEKREKQPPVPTPGQATKETIEDLIQEALDQAGSGLTVEDQKKISDEIVDKFQSSIGSTPGNQGIILDMTDTKVMIIGATYHEIFEKYLIDPLSGGKRTFMRPNRRSHGMKSPLRMPGKFPRRGHMNRLTHLVYALDISGSITAKQAQQFHDSVRTIKELLNPGKLTVLFFDTRIVLEKTFTDKEPYGTIKVSAGGGTDLKDVYRRTKELSPEALVIFTDLCVNIPPQPEWETIWLVPSKSNHVPAGIYGEVYLIPDN